MKALKRIVALILISLFVIGAVFISYTGIKNGAIVYADVVDDDILWQPLESENELVQAFQAYCKSRDVTIEGSIADAVTTATTGSFNGICNTLGIDITALQADIKKSTDGNGNLQFLFNESGIAAYNRIFAQFLQDNEIEVGDTDVEKVLKSGLFFKDLSGNSCWVYKTSVGASNFTNNNFILEEGTTYRYSGSDINSMIPDSNNSTVPISFNFKYYNGSNDVTGYTRTFYRHTATRRDYIDSNSSGSWNANSPKVYGYNGSTTYDSELVIFVPSGSAESNIRRYSLGYISYCNDGTKGITSLLNNIYVNQEDSTQNVTDIDILIVSTEVNNNNYEGDTIINNEGDIINNNPDNPEQPDLPDYPNEPTSNPSDWGAEMPDLNIPWYLQGKEDKFPWNIPFNIMLTLSLLKAEPQAPHFEGTMDFKFTTYDYEIDLSQFDDVAEVLRKMEVIAFLIGLMVLTRNLIGW